MTADLHVLTAAYVCDALSEPERAAYEQHLARCDSCRQEVAELQDTAALLGSAVSAEPSAAVHDRVMAQVRTVRQVPPRAASLSLARERRWRRWTRRTGWAAAAALVVCAAALGAVAAHLGGVAARENHQIASMRSERAAMSHFLAAADLRTTVGQASTGGVVTIMTSRSHDAMMVSASGLRPLPDSEAYQLWMHDAGGMRAGPVARPGAGGVIGPMMAKGIDGTTAVTIMAGPAGGSPHPAGTTVLVMKLTG
jgi:anti-sigma factor RsiW